MPSPFSVYIIESPSPTDLLNDFAEGRILRDVLRLSGIHCQYHLAVNEDTFSTALLTHYKAAFAPGEPPPTILHISAHGNQSGFGMTDGRLVEWKTLAPILRGFNKALQGRLILSMSACEGIYAFRMALSRDHEPFSYIVGPNGKPLWADSVVAFSSFYRLLVKGKAVEEAVEGMNHAVAEDYFKVFLGNSIRRVYLDILSGAKADQLQQMVNAEVPESSLSEVASESGSTGQPTI